MWDLWKINWFISGTRSALRYRKSQNWIWSQRRGRLDNEMHLQHSRWKTINRSYRGLCKNIVRTNVFFVCQRANINGNHIPRRFIIRSMDRTIIRVIFVGQKSALHFFAKLLSDKIESEYAQNMWMQSFTFLRVTGDASSWTKTAKF